MNFNLQPTLSNDLITLLPLEESDFENLYNVASDPLVWEQHPNFDRYQREVFRRFFDGAIESKGAFKIIDNTSGETVGSSRYYDLDEAKKSVAVGYTFIGRNFWGEKGYNKSIKKLMLDYAFQYVNKVIFHIGETNYRSQKATEKLGAIKVKAEETEINGSMQLKLTFEISKKHWPNAPKI